jgi:hypothetical protein
MRSAEDNFLDLGYMSSTTWVGSPVSVPGAGSASVVRGETLGITTRGAINMGMIQVTRQRGL